MRSTGPKATPALMRSGLASAWTIRAVWPTCAPSSSPAPLPTLTNVVGLIIDGYTQPGAEPPDGSNPAELKIVIDGNGSNCFVITGAQHLIRGLVIQSCYHGVEITGSNATDNVIAGNHIGTDVYGSTAAGNRHGVYIRAGAHEQHRRRRRAGRAECDLGQQLLWRFGSRERLQ